MSFRVLASLLNRLAPQLGFDSGSTVSYQTLINHVCRLGLGMINTPKGRIGASVCIVDFTINQGPVRVLPLLTVSEASMNLGSALTLKDVDCLNVIPMTRTRGEDIVAHYVQNFH